MKCDLFSGNFIQMETLRKGREQLEGVADVGQDVDHTDLQGAGVQKQQKAGEKVAADEIGLYGICAVFCEDQSAVMRQLIAGCHPVAELSTKAAEIRSHGIPPLRKK